MKKKKMTIKNIGLILFCVGFTSSLFAQAPQLGDLFNTANTELGNQVTVFQQVLNWIGIFVMGGGIIAALYAYIYDQSKMKVATIALIAGALILAVGAGMGVL